MVDLDPPSKWALLILALGDQIINQVHDLFDPENGPLSFTPIGSFRKLNYPLDHGIYPPQTATPAQIDSFLKLIQPNIESEINPRAMYERIATQARAARWSTAHPAAIATSNPPKPLIFGKFWTRSSRSKERARKRESYAEGKMACVYT